MEIKTVAVMGAGAVGGYFIWGLRRKLAENLWVVAQGSRARNLEEQGLYVNGERMPLHLRTPEQARGADLLLVATKYGALEEALPDIAAVADHHTVVMSLLNGVNSEDVIAGAVGRQAVLPAFMKIASERRGSAVFFDAETTAGMYYGEPDSPAVSDRMRAVAALLDGTPLHYHMVEDIQRQIWFKYALNVSQNLPQAVLGVGVGAYADSVHAAYLRDTLRAEVAALAAARGIDIAAPGEVGTTSPSAKRARYSTLQDLDARRRTEVDLFAGAAVEMGRELGVPTPCCEFVLHLIHALEEKNDGRFDY